MQLLNDLYKQSMQHGIQEQIRTMRDNPYISWVRDYEGECLLPLSPTFSVYGHGYKGIQGKKRSDGQYIRPIEHQGQRFVHGYINFLPMYYQQSAWHPLHMRALHILDNHLAHSVKRGEMTQQEQEERKERYYARLMNEPMLAYLFTELFPRYNYSAIDALGHAWRLLEEQKASTMTQSLSGIAVNEALLTEQALKGEGIRQSREGYEGIVLLHDQEIEDLWWIATGWKHMATGKQQPIAGFIQFEPILPQMVAWHMGERWVMQELRKYEQGNAYIPMRSYQKAMSEGSWLIPFVAAKLYHRVVHHKPQKRELTVLTQMNTQEFIEFVIDLVGKKA